VRQDKPSEVTTLVATATVEVTSWLSDAPEVVTPPVLGVSLA